MAAKKLQVGVDEARERLKDISYAIQALDIKQSTPQLTQALKDLKKLCEHQFAEIEQAFIFLHHRVETLEGKGESDD